MSEPMIKRPRAKQMSCDQVAHIKNALDRFENVIRSNPPSISRLVEASKMATVLELAELLDFDFEDDSARHNVISRFPEVYQGKRAS